MEAKERTLFRAISAMLVIAACLAVGGAVMASGSFGDEADFSFTPPPASSCPCPAGYACSVTYRDRCDSSKCCALNFILFKHDLTESWDASCNYLGSSYSCKWSSCSLTC